MNAKSELMQLLRSIRPSLVPPVVHATQNLPKTDVLHETMFKARPVTTARIPEKGVTIGVMKAISVRQDLAARAAATKAETKIAVVAETIADILLLHTLPITARTAV